MAAGSAKTLIRRRLHFGVARAFSPPMQISELSANHKWKASPGCRILVLDGGAVRVDLPRSWSIRQQPHSVVFYDLEPDAQFTVGLSWHRIPIEATELPVASLLEEGSCTETRPILERSETHRILRPPLEIVWLQLRLFDDAAAGERITRMCVARAGCTQAIMLCEFRPELEAAFFPIWQTMTSTLAVGDYIADPLTGRRHEQRG
jgi:hypothetical protein